MNDKTAKLIRKYATRSEEDHGSVRRRWLAMNHEERRKYRHKMKLAVLAAEK